ncbi:hypothetical protein DFH06DRAFT_1325824 [Mycena polygramma]|nr:hypothetical protein DFH06DRAFT_1325824 [Mycena polygramma]
MALKAETMPLYIQPSFNHTSTKLQLGLGLATELGQKYYTSSSFTSNCPNQNLCRSKTLNQNEVGKTPSHNCNNCSPKPYLTLHACTVLFLYLDPTPNQASLIRPVVRLLLIQLVSQPGEEEFGLRLTNLSLRRTLPQNEIETQQESDLRLGLIGNMYASSECEPQSCETQDSDNEVLRGVTRSPSVETETDSARDSGLDATRLEVRVRVREALGGGRKGGLARPSAGGTDGLWEAASTVRDIASERGGLGSGELTADGTGAATHLGAATCGTAFVLPGVLLRWRDLASAGVAFKSKQAVLSGERGGKSWPCFIWRLLA